MYLNSYSLQNFITVGLLFGVIIIFPRKGYSQNSGKIKWPIDSIMNLIPGSKGERFSQVLANKDIEVFLYAPRKSDDQRPHNRDEIYIVARGEGEYICDGTKLKFTSGDCLFAPALKEHHFENFSDDLIVWVIFYGKSIPSSKN